jgi:hypothetical protein
MDASAEGTRTEQKHRNDAFGQYSGNIPRAMKASIVGAFYSAPVVEAGHALHHGIGR